MNEVKDWMELANVEIVAGNTIGNALGLLICLMAAWMLGRIIGTAFDILAKKSHDEAVVRQSIFKAAAKAAPLIGAVLGFKFGVLFLDLGEPGHGVARFVEILVGIIFTIGIAMAVSHFVSVPDTWMHRHVSRSKSKMDDMLLPIMRKSLKAVIWLLALINIAQILSDQPISSIIAGLGIGGLAFALAAQDSLKQIFGAFVIFADKPFELGERIIYGEHDGVVEEVGLRSTRLRRLDGNLVTIPNGDLANSAIHNPGRRPSIRRVFNITITYDTPPEKVREGKAIILDILKDHEGMDPKGELIPRCVFMDFNDASLGYLCLYWYFPANWWDYCAFTERVNLEILERFNAAGIEFAFPTQTLYLAGDPNRKLNLGINDMKDVPPAFKE
jgi:MscS family membrane protein